MRSVLAATAASILLACSPPPQTSSGAPIVTGPEDAGYDPTPTPTATAPSAVRAIIPPPATPATGHPRLLVREADLPRLRGWAVPQNPIFSNGLNALVGECSAKVDAGEVPNKDPGTATGYTQYPTEACAELFAFMSLVGSESTRPEWAKKARTLLMYAIDKASAGAGQGQFRDPGLSTNDRSRWSGEGWALTVDWIYGSLSSADKAKIRGVFLRWADEMMKSNVVGDKLDHPEPAGLLNDPKLLAERRRVRWAANNYFTGHTRNMGLMAMSFDPADDPGGKLGNYMNQVTGAWLYMSDHLMRTDEAGGLGAEGFEYSPQAVGYIAQLLAAVATAGRSSAKVPQATFSNPFWNDVVPAYIHSLSPAGQISSDSNYQYLGPLHSVAWYGDGEKFYAGDPMGMMGAFGIYADLTQDDKKLNMLRWVETNLPPGGTMELSARGKDTGAFISSIFYFLMFDPKAPAPTDPRPSLPLAHFAPGLGRILARTSWTRDATWFTYKLGWSQIDHQHGDGNMFELYRKGEWLTKERTGYGFEVACSDYKNSLGLQNDVPAHNDNGYRGVEYKRGSQWLYVAEGDGKILAHSITPKFVYALGDATPLYNSKEEHATDIVHASRSILWLSPDRIVVYDRAESKTDKRYKRFWLNLPKVATVKDGLATMPSTGQKLFVRALLPSPQSMTVEPAEPLDFNGNKQPAVLDPITYRLKTEAKGGPRSARFLHVLQAADKDVAADTVTLVKSTGGTPYEGASMNDVVVMFPVDIGKASSIAYTSQAKVHIITGLTPGAGYKVSSQNGKVSISTGGDQKADSGGVLVIGQLP